MAMRGPLRSMVLVLCCIPFIWCGGCGLTSSDPATIVTPTLRDSDVQPSPSPTGAGVETVTVESNTQITLGDVRIGVGNIREEEYTPEGGAPRRGLTGGLWIYVRDNPTQDRHERVHPGQTVMVPGYRLVIVAVERRAIRMEVHRV
jgi:hypothetical protein